MRTTTLAWGSGMLGVLIFSGSLPATRVAVGDFDPFFLTAARAAIAGLLGGAMLLSLRQPLPNRSDFGPLLIVALGVVIGFPLLTALALQQITAAHSIVYIGLLPLFTAIFGVVRGGEKPRAAFWLFSCLGSLLVAGFALHQSGSSITGGDLLMLAALLAAALGYAEGATLSRRLGGWQVISWSLVIALPVMTAMSISMQPTAWNGITLPAWVGLGYISVFSMLVGFVFWYRGLALGGIAGVGQLQLLQPFFGLLLAAVLLGEAVTWPMIAVAVLVVCCVFGAKKFTAPPGATEKGG